MVFKFLVVGWQILIFAILSNFLANKAGIDTWYSFSLLVAESGFIKAFLSLNLISQIFLFVIYPGLLGLASFLGTKFVKKLFL